MYIYFQLREEALQKELYITRLALLKQTCQHCNNAQFVSEEQVNFANILMKIAYSLKS